MSGAQRDIDGILRRSVPSREKIELDLADIFPSGTIEGVTPVVVEKSLLSVGIRNRSVVVTAGPFIGQIPLTSSVVIEVTPKLPVANVGRILEVASAFLTPLNGQERFYRSDPASTGSILEFMARNLTEAIRTIGSHGLHKEYVEVRHTGTYPIGSLDLDATLAGPRSRGDMRSIGSRRWEQTPNIPVNRVIKEAARSTLLRMSGPAGYPASTASALAEAWSRLSTSVGPLRAGDIERVSEVMAGGSLPAFRSYYWRGLTISLMLLAGSGVSLRDHGRDVAMDTFILNFETVFEDYVRNVLRGHAPAGIEVLDGNGSAKRKLFDGGDLYVAKPDTVLVDRGRNRQLVLEVKYRRKIERPDINQAITYAVAYGTKRVVLVHQRETGRQVGLRSLGVTGDIEVLVFALDLDDADFRKVETDFAQIMLSLLGTSVEATSGSLVTGAQ